MRMSAFEKRLVNGLSHSRHVAKRAVERLRGLPLDANWTYLAVGCDNGVATLHVADTLDLSVVASMWTPNRFGSRN